MTVVGLFLHTLLRSGLGLLFFFFFFFLAEHINFPSSAHSTAPGQLAKNKRLPS